MKRSAPISTCGHAAVSGCTSAPSSSPTKESTSRCARSSAPAPHTECRRTLSVYSTSGRHGYSDAEGREPYRSSYPPRGIPSAAAITAVRLLQRIGEPFQAGADLVGGSAVADPEMRRRFEEGARADSGLVLSH